MARYWDSKEFIETAELDRINELVESEPSYFYDILQQPYLLQD